MLLLGMKLCDFAAGSEVGSKDMIFLVKMGRRVFISDFEEMCSRVPGFVPGLPWAELFKQNNGFIRILHFWVFPGSRVVPGLNSVKIKENQ